LIEIINLTSSDILDSVKECWTRLEGKYVGIDRELEDQKKFWSVLNNHRYFSRYHGYIHDDAKM